MTRCRVVALRKESVDRNAGKAPYMENAVVSLSARRAWIEILKQLLLKTLKAVALRKESVDRNSDITSILSQPNRRSPQGERG